jgi:hypothetical protein
VLGCSRVFITNFPGIFPTLWSAEVNPIGKVQDLGTEELLEFR